MMKRIISILLVLLITVTSVFSLLSCSITEDSGQTGGNNNGGTNYTTKSKVVSYLHFNTVSTIYSYGTATESEFASYAQMVDDMLGYYHKLFDIYYIYSGINNICKINSKAGIEPVQVDRELIDFLLYCKELYTLTNGETNIMLGSVLKIWHDAREYAEETDGYLDTKDLPTEAELLEAAKHTSIDSLVIDVEASTVYISDPEASIDVGAVAKGYAVDKLYEMLVAEGADSVALNIGGNLRTIGKKPDGANWVTGITNPDKTSSETIKCRIEIGSTSVVTSGDYERFFTSGGVRYHHIIDPDTLTPASYFSSVTIITENSALADALSTALFCMSYEEGRGLADSLAGVEVVWIYKDGTLSHTSGITFASQS